MTVAAGTRLGPYEILSLLGAGGMGEVYRARDSKLGRDVALKILPASFTHDAERVARFRREAQLLAALNHPHIAQIHGLEDAGDIQFLVLELVDGASLAGRLKRGPLPMDEALDIAQQVAEALDAAHEKGIIHRDLKPANIALTHDGQVKVLDFGLAKAADGVSAGAVDVANSPTITSPAMITGVSTILGTAAYMSPEQAKGRAADKRSDVWAFGCVLYEMLVGTRPFDGEDVSETLAAVLRAEPDWAALPANMPASIRRLLRRTLEKDRRQRLADIADARLDINDAAQESRAGASALPSVRISRRREAVWAAAVVALVLSCGALGLRVFFTPAAQAPAVRFDILPPPGVTLAVAAVPQLSPDGRKLAFVAASQSQSRIWVRSLDAAAAQPLQGTEGAEPRPFWSADSQFIGFADAEGTLKKISVAGGPPQVITKSTQRDGTWNADGVILLGGNGPLQRVSASGGEPAAETELDKSRGETAHQYPSFLPDGQHYLFLARSHAPNGDSQEPTVWVGTLGSKARQRLPGITAGAKYSATGHLLFVRGSTLMAQPFDVQRLALHGEAFPITAGGASGPFSVALNGSLTYRAGVQGGSTLGWFDRKGSDLGLAAPLGQFRSLGLDLSPDGQSVAISDISAPDIQIRVLDLRNGRTTRLTSTSGVNPVWSPDGKSIVFMSSLGERTALYQRAVGVVGEDTILLKEMPDPFMAPWSWSRDGRYLAFETNARKRATLWALPTFGERKPLRIADVDAPKPLALHAAISPDARWIAYQARESGRDEVFIQSFPEPGLKQQVSTAGGVQPCWNRDGKELFYVAPDGVLMSVAVSAGRSTLELSPRALFQTRLLGADAGKAYDVSPDGRFLMSVTTEQAGGQPAPITVILNWFTPFKK